MLVKKIILIILALGAVGTLSFFLLNKNSLPEVTQQVGMEKENLDDQWLTYTNDSYQYEIKYHRDWHKQEENEPPYPPPPAGMNFSRRWLEPLEVCDFQISSSDIQDKGICFSTKRAINNFFLGHKIPYRVLEFNPSENNLNLIVELFSSDNDYNISALKEHLKYTKP